jgi:hypothetical protein
MKLGLKRVNNITVILYVEQKSNQMLKHVFVYSLKFLVPQNYGLKFSLIGTDFV